MYIDLNEEQRKNLMIFLDRVELKGKEVFAYIDILKTLQEPVKKEDDK